MRILQQKIKNVGRSKVFRIIPLSDIHLGNVGCDVRKFLKYVNMIAEDPYTYWIGLGDLCECININDKRFDPYSIDPSYEIKDISRLISIQMQDMVSYLKPIANKCLGFFTGNHEESIRLRYHRDIIYEIADRLGIPEKNMGYDGFIRLSFLRGNEKNAHSDSFTIYCSHGYGSSRKNGAKVNRLEDMARVMDADIIIMAHEHKKIIAPPVLRLGVNRLGNLIQRKQLSVMSGSFLKGYVENATTYIEKKGYAPTDLGTIQIFIHPDKGDIWASQ